ncbi:toprim domain-containing protein [Virgibacillus sp. MSJ-26]|uniref:toprim domain-containing protein n=1 Tax=Virgibacillus sp. MSJ-26 TaxID=2841522 RepID=UPI00209F0B0C|nr:toprim domain-containing protein [Virgibacillus sp. MSJ-26]
MMNLSNQSLYKKLVYQNIENALDDLNAEDKGRYYICNCPECNEHEAFIYKNNTNFIQCNRENYCGERMLLQFHEKKKTHPTTEKVDESYLNLSEDQKRALAWSMRFFPFAKKALKSEAMDKGYRGLSKENVRQHVIDLQNKEVVQYFFKKTSSLLGKDYSKSSWMCERNIMIPLYGVDNTIDRLLLRSSINPSTEPKEIQLILNPSKETRDFFVDIPKNTESVVFCESLLDALSFREIDKNCGFVALTGAAKTRQVDSYINKNKHIFKDKQLCIAMDDDKAGREATRKLTNILKKQQLEEGTSIFRYDAACKDPNEFLQTNRKQFKNRYKENMKQLESVKEAER